MRIYDLTSHGWLAEFPISGIISLLLLATKIGEPLLYAWRYLAMLFGSYDSQQSRVFSCFPSLAVCIPTSGTMKTTLQGGGFQVRSSSDSVSPEYKVYDVFHSRNFNLWEATKDNSNVL